MFTNLEQSSWNKIEVTRCRSTQECFRRQREACGDAALPYRTVTQWVKAFRTGRPHGENNTVQLLAFLLDAEGLRVT